MARSTLPRQNVKNTSCSDHFWTFRSRFVWQVQGIAHLVKSEQTVRVLWQFQLQPPVPFTTLQNTTLHYTPRQYTPMHDPQTAVVQTAFSILQKASGVVATLVFFSMFLVDLRGDFAQMCPECIWLTWSQHLSPHELWN